MSILNPQGTMFPHKIVYPPICPGSEVEGGGTAGGHRCPPTRLFILTNFSSFLVEFSFCSFQYILYSPQLVILNCYFSIDTQKKYGASSFDRSLAKSFRSFHSTTI